MCRRVHLAVIDHFFDETLNYNWIVWHRIDSF
jgi:hypothetical protein